MLCGVFRRLVRLGSFLACWRQANVTPIPKGPPSSSVSNYRPISITSVLSKVFEHLVSVRLGRFMEPSGGLPTTQFVYRKGLGTCDALLCLSHRLQRALESGQEARIVQIDFSAAFDRVNHLGILYKLCSVGVAGSVLSILTQFLSNRYQQVMVDGCPGECSMIDRFLGGAFGVLSCQFWSAVLQSGARLPIHTINYRTEQSVVPGF